MNTGKTVQVPLLVSPAPFQDLLVDQTIEKVSFCAPDRNLDKAFSYICRDGTTRRWICHCFLALKDSVSITGAGRKLAGCSSAGSGQTLISLLCSPCPSQLLT